MSDYSLNIYDSKIYIDLQLSIYVRLRIFQYFHYSIKTEIHFYTNCKYLWIGRKLCPKIFCT